MCPSTLPHSVGHALPAAAVAILAIFSPACRAQDANAGARAASAVALVTPPEATQPSAPPQVAGVDAADAGAVTFNFEADEASRYVFRGLAASGGAVAQPALYASRRGTTLGLWGNLNGTRRLSDRRGLNEIDVTLSRSIERGRTTIEPGVLLYLSTRGEFPSTGEVSMRLARRRGKAAIFSDHYLDFRRYKGAYFGDVGVSREHTFSSKVSGEAKISLGFGSAKYHEAYVGPRKAALSVLALDLSVTRVLSERLYLRPHLSLSRLLDSELRGAVDDATILSAGVAVGSDF